jgi:hypothetical protein
MGRIGAYKHWSNAKRAYRPCWSVSVARLSRRQRLLRYNAAQAYSITSSARAINVPPFYKRWRTAETA